MARLGTRGFTWGYNIDYLDTFNLVVTPVMVQLVISLAVMGDFHLRKVDIINSFPYCVLEETTYMQ
jgi:hypothetical protein